MDGLEIPVKILIALALGAVIGLEREINEKKTATMGKKATATLGLRSFALTTGLGAIAGLSFILNAPYIGIFIGLAALMLFAAFYIIDTLQTKETGITTEIALIYSFILGGIVGTGIFPVQIVVAITIVLVLFLSRKEYIKDVVEDIQKKEINAFISYAILALVILPFLPNNSYSLSDFAGLTSFLEKVNVNLRGLEQIEIINPFKLWLIVVLITGVDVAGYILEKTIGQKKGWIAASLAGGFISSTATTISIAKQSRETTRINHLLSSALLANMVSFFPVLIILATLNVGFFIAALPTLAIVILSAFALSMFFLFKREKESKKTQKSAKQTNIFSLTSALKFAGIYLIVSIVSRVAIVLFGKTGFLAASAIGALPGIDAVVINTAQLVGQQISFQTGIIALIIINAVNLGAKTVYSFMQGKKDFAIKFGISVLGITAASLAGLLLV